MFTYLIAIGFLVSLCLIAFVDQSRLNQWIDQENLFLTFIGFSALAVARLIWSI